MFNISLIHTLNTCAFLCVRHVFRYVDIFLVYIISLGVVNDIRVSNIHEKSYTLYKYISNIVSGGC